MSWKYYLGLGDLWFGLNFLVYNIFMGKEMNKTNVAMGQ